MIRITKKGFAYRKWDSGKEDYEEVILKIPTMLQLHSEECEIDDNVTLGDIFLIIKQNMDWWELILEDWSREFVDEALKPVLVTSVDENDPVEYLELYWGVEEWDGEISLPTFMSFHGKGKPDEYDCVNYGVSFTPANELAKLPIKVNTEFVIYKSLKKSPFFEEKYKGVAKPTLFQIIYGIFWELSFYGGPEDRDAQFAELKRRCDEVKNGKAKLIPWEEVKENLGIEMEDEDDG